MSLHFPCWSEQRSAFPHSQAASTDSVYPDFLWLMPDWTPPPLSMKTGEHNCSASQSERFLKSVVVVSPTYSETSQEATVGYHIWLLHATYVVTQTFCSC